MRRVLTLTISLWLIANSATATEPNQGYDILKASEKALKKLKTVAYQAQYQGTGWVKDLVPKLEGRTVMGGRSKHNLDKFRSEIKLTPANSEEVLEYTVGSNGDLFFLIDPKERMIYEDMDSAVLGSKSRDFQRLLMTAYTAPNPYGEDLKAESVELTGSAKIGEEDCHEVKIKGAQPPEVIWSISKIDLLPRKVVRIYPNRQDPEGEPGTTELEVTYIVIDPRFTKDPFIAVLEPGYAKTDEFAP